MSCSLYSSAILFKFLRIEQKQSVNLYESEKYSKGRDTILTFRWDPRNTHF